MDRTALVPAHTGPLVLPNSPFFGKLLRHARRGRMAIRDVVAGVEKTYEDLLGDALSLRAEIERTLNPHVLKQLQRDEEVFIGVLAAGGYEFAVAVVATLAIGAAVVPMSVAVSLDEAEYYVQKSNQVVVLSSSAASSLASTVVTSIKKKHVSDIKNITVLSHLRRKKISALSIVISSNPPLSDASAGVVIFTSGTTGKPKGAVLRRSYTHYTAEAIGEGYDIDYNDTLLHVLPVHHTTGLGTSFFPWMVAGGTIEFRSGPKFSPEWIWNRWVQGGITVFSGVPTIYMRLRWHFEQNIANLPEEEKQKFITAVNQMRVLKCGSSALQKDVQVFFTKLRNGRPILTRYGATEFPGCIKVPSNMDPTTLPDDCVGMVVPGVEVKLSNGEAGELLVKSPYMFSRYLHNEKATKEAHDENGYFKTGDIGRREGDMFFITGRASVDILKSGGYKISAIEIERALMELPYVKEVAVIGVADDEYGQRVGAMLVTQGVELTLTLDTLRKDLKDKLAKYKMPTLLRLFNGELPKGPTGKVQKKVLGEKYFPSPGWEKDSNVQALNTEAATKAKL